jgi:hypothetical protein
MTDSPSSRLSERELAARLLAAGSRERPSSHSLERTLSALGLGAAALGASGAASAAAAPATAALGASPVATAFGVGTLVKFIALGAAGGLLFAVSAERLSRSPEAPSRVLEHSPRTLQSARAQRAEPPQRRPADAQKSSNIAQITAGSVRAATSGAAASADPRFSPAGSSRAQSSTVPNNSLLAQEIAFVDRGRSAFQRGEFGTTLAVLEGYERSFAGARLLPEVLYLRMQALEQSGQVESAIDLARRLVREFPNNPQAARARAILGSPRPR